MLLNVRLSFLSSRTIKRDYSGYESDFMCILILQYISSLGAFVDTVVGCATRVWHCQFILKEVPPVTCNRATSIQAEINSRIAVSHCDDCSVFSLLPQLYGAINHYCVTTNKDIGSNWGTHGDTNL